MGVMEDKHSTLGHEVEKAVHVTDQESGFVA
jgi:hypothetical protein